MRKIAITIFSIFMMAGIAMAQQTRICPYTGQPYVVPTVTPTSYPSPVYQPVDQQRLVQQQNQRAIMQAQHTLQRDQLMIQQRIQMLQLEHTFKAPASQMDTQMLQQQLQQLQQEQQSIQQRYNDEMRRIQQMR